MAVKTGPTLSPELSAKLSSLGERLEHGPPEGELHDVLDDLSALPADRIVRASCEIPAAAGLGMWRPHRPFSIHRLLRRPLSENDLLKVNPNYGWLFLFHPSGYVREAALHAIRTPPTSPFFFAAIAWRLNDWVEQVRQAAADCASRVLPRADPTVAATAALYLLDRQFVWGRWNDVPKVLHSTFSDKNVIASLAGNLRERSTGRLATCLRYALKYPNIDEHLPSLAAEAIQSTVRALAYQCLLTGKIVWPTGYEWAWVDKVYGVRRRVPKLEARSLNGTPVVADLIRQALRDPSPKVRRVGADALIENRKHLPDADRLIGVLAADASPSVRSRADYMLRHPTNAAQ